MDMKRVKAQLGTKGFYLPDELIEVECAYIEAAMNLSEGVVSRAARLLRISRPGMYVKLKKLEAWKRRVGAKKF